MNAAAAGRSAPVASAGPAAEQFLTFRVGEELFAIPVLAVREIRGWERVAQIPHARAHILGVINLRGTVVPVLDVRTRFGMPPREATATTVVIVVCIDSAAGVATTVGCVVDAVSDVITIGAAEVRAAPDACGTVERHFIRGVASLDAQLVLLLEVGLLIEAAAGATAGATAPAATGA